MAISDANTYELISRFDSLVKKYVPLAAELAPKFEKFGKYRRELQAIAAELKERGVEPEDSEDLVRIIEVELEKRGAETDEEQHSMEGRGEPRENPGQIDQ